MIADLDLLPGLIESILGPLTDSSAQFLLTTSGNFTLNLFILDSLLLASNGVKVAPCL